MIRQFVKLFRWPSHLLGKCSGQAFFAHGVKIRADVVLLNVTPFACVVTHEGFDHNPVARLQVLYVFADLFYNSGRLMSRDLTFKMWVFNFPMAQVGTTYSGYLD